MEQFITNFEQYGGWAVLFGLVSGSVLLVFAGYMNWHGTIKAHCVRWMAKTVYHERAGSEAEAENVFGGVTSFLVAMGIMLIATALLLLATPPA